MINKTFLFHAGICKDIIESSGSSESKSNALGGQQNACIYIIQNTVFEALPEKHLTCNKVGAFLP